MPNSDSILSGGDNPDAEEGSQILSPKDMEKALRVHCAHGAPLVTTRQLPSEAELDRVNATGVVIPQSAGPRQVESVLERSNRVIFHTLHPQRVSDYVNRTEQYVGFHGKEVPTEEGARLGGPGLVTMTTLDALGELEAIKKSHRAGKNANARDKLMEHGFEQPVIVRVNKAEDVLTPDVKLRVLAHEIEGFSFSNAEEMLQFRAGWKGVALSGEDQNLVIPEPSILLEATPAELLAFFGNEQHFDAGTPCDGYIATEPLNENTADGIWNARVDRIAETHDEPWEFPEGALRIGVINLQGASKVERWLLRQLQQQILTWMNIHIKMVHTREEIENLHGIVYPGGWHGPQLMFYNDERLGINDAVREAIQQERLGVFFSCAGAIGAGNPHKERIGCSQHPPSNFLDYGIHNNRFSGRIPMRFRTGENGGEHWEERPTNTAGAPVFLNPNPEQLQAIVTTMGHEPVAVRKRVPLTTPPIYASGVHSTLVASEWLEQLAASQAEKRRRGVTD